MVSISSLAVLADLTTYTVGGTTYTTGTVNGQRVNTSSYKVGGTTYQNVNFSTPSSPSHGNGRSPGSGRW